MFLVKSVTFLTIVLLASLWKHSDAATYHVVLLGRDPPESPGPHKNVAELHFPPASDAPVITAGNSSCAMSNYDGTASVATLGTDCEDLIANATEIQPKAIKVETSSEQLNVIQFDNGMQQDGYLAFPDDKLGTEYYAVTYCEMGGVCQLAVAGTKDATSVFISFSKTADNIAACIGGVPNTDTIQPGTQIPFTLNDFDVLHIESTNDLTGTYIQASSKVAVFTGTRGIKGRMAEQLLPTNKWGKEFIVMPNYLNDAGDLIKIVTKNETTKLEISGYSPFVIKKKGSHTILRIDSGMDSKITASNPVSVLQVMSIDLYNDSTAVNGHPAMVLVPSVKQMANTSYTVCVFNAAFCHVSLVAAKTFSISDITQTPSPTPTSSPIPGTEYNVLRANVTWSNQPILLSSDTIFASYLYSNNATAMLMGIDLEADVEECLPSESFPGDDIDNDCDGLIDEDSCDMSDFEKTFTSEQDGNGTVNSLTVFVAGSSMLRFSVSTCGVANAKLSALGDKQFVHILLSPTLVAAERCATQCDQGQNKALNTGDCLDNQRFWIKWDSGVFKIGWNQDSLNDITIDNSLYHKMEFSSLVDNTTFVIETPDKDCAKIISDIPDTLGRNFVVPVATADEFYIFITTVQQNTDFKYYPKTDTHNANVDNKDTMKLNEHNFTQPYESVVVEVTSNDREVSVYVIKKISNKWTGFHVIPRDVLGPTFYYKSSSAQCSVYSPYKHVVFEDKDPTGPVYEFKRKDVTKEGFHSSRQPAAVFCATPNNTLTQMPPVETLGTHFYIPAINFSLISELISANIHIVTTEDSSYIQVLGDYHQEDIVDLKSTVHSRPFFTSELFEIISNKPVYVELEFIFSGNWASNVVIPPVEQYKATSFFPKFGSDYTVLESVYVDKDGETIHLGHPDLNDVKNITNSKPFFSLTFLRSSPEYYVFVVQSDVGYEDLNEVCEMKSNGTVMDGLDADCDLLVDEDYCVLAAVAGEVDYDIDGNINEDCYDGDVTDEANLNIGITSSMVNCNAPPITTPAPVTNSGSSGSTSPSDSSTAGSYDQPPAPEDDPEPTFTEIVPSVIVAIPTQAPTTTSDVTATTGAPEDENCFWDCVCPCGWVKVENYTTEEIEQLVLQIQEKLKINKQELSAAIRTKISAKDNRTSATAIGYVGLAFLVVTIAAIFLLDVTSITRDLCVLLDNIRNVYQN